jgi:glycosyltransferase involved in cell wall biosynthesis
VVSSSNQAAGSQMSFEARLGLQQRVLPAYRAPFFNLLGRSSVQGLSVFAGEPRSDETIRNATDLEFAEWIRADNTYLLSASWYFLWQKGIIGWLNRADPDVLILEANPRYLSNRAAMRWMHERKRPVIGWALGAPANSGFLAGARTWLRRRYLLRFDALIAYSSKGAAEYMEVGFPQERIFTAYNAVASAPKTKPERTSLRGRRPRLLFVGRLQPRKRIDLLLEACAHLGEEVELVIVGDGPARGRFEALAAELLPRARFTGAVYGEALQSWFEWADIFILPGTGGLAVQQAMAAGLPVIVARGDGTQSDLVTPQNGWLVPPDDVEGLLEAIKAALQDPEAMLEMGLASYELSRTRFNIEAMAAVFLKAIDSVWKA